MTIKIKFRETDKAIIRFNNQMDKEYFLFIMRKHRDDGTPHPKISLKDVKGEEIPPYPKPPEVKPLPKVDLQTQTKIVEGEIKK